MCDDEILFSRVRKNKKYPCSTWQKKLNEQTSSKSKIWFQPLPPQETHEMCPIIIKAQQLLNGASKEKLEIEWEKIFDYVSSEVCWVGLSNYKVSGNYDAEKKSNE